MPDAPAVPTQTPGLIVKAGDIGMFSSECVALLAKAGYSPDDFGSHAYVQEQIQGAKRKVREYDEAVARGVTPLPPEPTERDVLLAHCTSGHLSQDGLYHAPAPPGGSESDPCLNHQPGGARGGDARGYQRDLAPAMPLLTSERGSSQPLPESLHQDVDQAEKAQAASAIADAKARGASTATIGQDTLAKNAQDNAAIALGERKDPASMPPQHAQALAAAQAGAAPAPPAAVEGPKDGTGDEKSDKPSQEFTGKTAAECVESFRKAMMKHMREDAVRKHGTPEAHAATQAAAQKKVDDAKQKLADAQAAQRAKGTTQSENDKRIRQLEQRPKPTEKQQQELADRKEKREEMRNDQRAVDQANANLKDAQTELKGGDCMRQQVTSMQAQGNMNPDWKGVVPGWPESEQSGR